ARLARCLGRPSPDAPALPRRSLRRGAASDRRAGAGALRRVGGGPGSRNLVRERLRSQRAAVTPRSTDGGAMSDRGWGAHAARLGRWTVAAASACAIVGLLSTAGEARTVSPSRALPPAKVGAGVYRALARGPRVRVIVALRGGGVGRSLASRPGDVRLLQNRVLRRPHRRDFPLAARRRARPPPPRAGPPPP